MCIWLKSIAFPVSSIQKVYTSSWGRPSWYCRREIPRWKGRILWHASCYQADPTWMAYQAIRTCCSNLR
jgi:hypothetical protein